ncbi:phosphoglycerate kinase [bacterium]|nr:phosphoglycerate kinase [bacterium]|tara:strand:- start:10307 stop:11440 length:1134 start_codon:yes stop_codon:yes gene_type:complete
MELRDITKEKDLKGKRVLLRLDLNVPLEDGKIANDFRIRKNGRVISYLHKVGARTVIIAHLGKDGRESLAPVASYLQKKYLHLEFLPTAVVGAEVIQKTKEMNDGDIIMLDNLRKNPGEKENDPGFAEDLSLLGDIYVNEAFAVSHREHASIVRLPHCLPSYVGPVFLEELEGLGKALAPTPPFYVVLGGAKISTKLPIVEKFIGVADNIFLYGALAHDVLYAKGYEIGDSLVDKGIDVSHIVDNKKIILPIDVVVTNKKEGRSIKPIEEVSKGDIIFDEGPESILKIKNTLKEAATVLWNGPLGNFEAGFTQATEDAAMIISDLDAFSVVGGGDTIAAIQKLGLNEKFSFISTGGGAMLEYLAKGTLAGIDALEGR